MLIDPNGIGVAMFKFIIIFSSVIFCLFFFTTPDLSFAGKDRTLEVTVSTNAQGPVSLFCLPNGGGMSFAGANATIYVTLVMDGTPVENLPAPGITLGGYPGDLFVCNGGSNADYDTNHLGMTLWNEPLQVGGHLDPNDGDLLCVFVEDVAYPDPVLAGFRINSADINGDGNVNLTDIQFFAGDFFGPYQYRSDFHWDGVLNLADIGLLASSVWASCP